MILRLSDQLRVWRLGDTRFPLYSSVGARLIGGRWNSPGIDVIYAAATLEGAMLELRVHTNGLPPPLRHGYIWIDIPAGASREVVTNRTIKGWRQSAAATQAFGDRWVREKRSCILLVPSVIVPRPFFNVVINPAHSDAQGIVHLMKPRRLKWDSRLFE